MAFEPIFPFDGNVLGDPELRFTANGIAVCNLRIGLNDNRASSNNGREDVPSIVADVTVWREMAENVAETISDKTRVTGKARIVDVGAYISKKTSEPVGVLKIEALEIGPSLRYATAQVQKVEKRGGGNQGGNQQGNQGGGGWGGNQQGNQGQGGGWGNQGGGQQGGDPWAGGGHPGQQGGGNQQGGGQQGQSQGQQGQGGGWGSDQGWGNSGGTQGGDPWGGN